MKNSNVAQTEHEDVELLLPWYLNGSLSRNEAFRVSQHIENCEVCGSDVNLVSTLLEVSVPTDVPLDSGDARLKRVVNRIDAYEAKRRSETASDVGWLPRLMESAKHFLPSNRLIPTAALAVLATALTMQFLITPERQEYEVRTSGVTENSNLVLRVALHTPMQQAQMKTLIDSEQIAYSWLATSGEEIVISLPDDIQANDMFVLISRLEAQQAVKSVETALREQ